jgi:UDP-N-acetylmuramate dehydrogenase
MTSFKDFAPILSENVPLARLTSMRVGGPVRFLFEPRSQAELASLLDVLRRENILVRVIGGGSNVVASDDGFPGAVIRLAGEFAYLSFEGPAVTAGAAVPLPRFVRECAQRGLSGAEGLVGIPGTLGGALVMNAGGRWGEICRLVRTARIMTLQGDVKDVGPEMLTFGYRHSSLTGSVVLSAVFQLHQSDERSVEAAKRNFLDKKRATQDLGSLSAGCIFKNPPGEVSAGALIDQAGLKGTALGGAKVSEIHANFLINTGSASAKDVLDLARLVRNRVLETSGVDLEFEVQLW